MKLLLAVSVLLATVFVLAEANPTDETKTFKDHIESVGTSIKQFASKVGDKAKEVIKDIHETEFAKKSREWISDTFQKIKGKISSS
ncbi:hypothetical protein GDO86_012307 [Hymenochirus boettgeri]|uniref:Apolipoprotein C-I n=1 Tax=Hymenochirus boettgeri TaxID=247094 RepID=A0A8T2IUP4_9PIPI|nr:hypothetical protein GDO86_012307 [Hymenochirus boettgeri]